MFGRTDGDRDDEDLVLRTYKDCHNPYPLTAEYFKQQANSFWKTYKACLEERSTAQKERKRVALEELYLNRARRPRPAKPAPIPLAKETRPRTAGSAPIAPAKETRYTHYSRWHLRAMLLLDQAGKLETLAMTSTWLSLIQTYDIVSRSNISDLLDDGAASIAL
jgi:hypothetical protein